MDEDSEDLRRQLIAVRRDKSQKRRYPRQVREAVQSYVRERVAAGARIKEVCGELEVPWGTVRRWVQGTEPQASEVGVGAVAFRPVVIARRRCAASISAASLSLSSPRGYRAEGLGLEQLLYLLRELG